VLGSSGISVVIPYYNRERYIDETVRSVLAQTLKPLEIILVNDCSRESSRKFLDRYRDVCTIIDLPVNVGLAGSRNAGIQHAQGEFVAFLDDDDLWLPQKLEVQRRYLDEHPECAIVHTAAWFFFRDRPDILFTNFKDGPMTLAQSLTNGFWAIIPTVLMRTEVARAVGGFDASFRVCEDRDFIIRCCAAGYWVEGISKGLARIRRENQAGLTKSYWSLFRTDLRMCWKHKAHYFGAYGLPGITSFILEKIQIVMQALPGLRTWRYREMKYKLRSNFRDPILTGKHPNSQPPWQAPTDKANLAGGNAL
jgi:glycosyltransferase involved in cell wall biosynthesis